MKSDKVYLEFLVLEAQLGKVPAWETLLPLLQPKIRAFANRLLSGGSAVDDCVQDVLMTVSHKLYQLKEAKAFHTWLYRIVSNWCHDHHRKQNKFQPLSAAEESDEGRSQTNQSNQIDVMRAIRQLPGEQQAVIYLFYYEGFQITEVSEILKKPVGTVKSLLFVARNHIKNIIESE